jgi:tRNA A-37 threonylcarbamoyl transferase component Bud32/dipeptidyl aminopeptidase/acylaminoacyl peptidase
MTLPAGARFNHYEILSPLGEGGMGEVYRASDTKLDRQVAIKVLPEAFTQDPERLARFEREAQLLAQLHHPNISSIFGLEDSNGVRALVMELVEGPTLAERLESGPLPLDECLSVARQIAEALEEAHEKGIVHRDLKPQNVKASPDGKVKVLDFGLAKALDPGGASASSASLLSKSPTLMHGGTQMGTILGTAAYMAPEQATGATVDRRADIWSFGVVLYEMLTGRRLFDGETVSHVLAAVLKDTPDFTALPAETPARIEDLLRRCLRKRPRERLQAIGDARVVIEEVLADPSHGEHDATGSAGASPAMTRASRFAWIVATTGLAAAVLFAILWRGAGRGEAPSHALQAALVAPDGMGFGDTFALSPDGRRIVFDAYDRKTGARALWLRALDRGEATRLAATEGGEMPFWSPDGAHIGFFAEGKLKRLDPQGGPAQVIGDAPTPRGGAWGPDGRIVFTGAFRSGLSIVPAGGGTPTPLTSLDASRKEKSHRFPTFLPGGKSILFLAQTAEGGSPNDQSTIEALELSSGKRTRLITANSSVLFSPGGQILFWRDGTLLAVRFDPSSLKLAGDPLTIAAPVAFTQNEQVLASVSNEGTLVYREGSRGTSSSLAWFDRDGIGTQVIRDRELFQDMALSHDGKRLAFSVNSPGQGSTDLWIQDLVRGSASRLTFEEGGEYPVWSRDDRFLYYSSDLRNDGTIFRRTSDGTGSAGEVGATEQGFWPLAASSDGRWLVTGAMSAETDLDLLRFDLATKELTPLVATPFADDYPALSPDDHLLAYSSEQSGRWEVYVQALGGGSGKWQISTEGGLRPHWRADGRELFFLTRPDRLMSVEVEAGPVPRFSAPRELFRHPMEAFDVAPDGQRVVGLRPADGDAGKPLTVVTNWTQRVPN